MQTSPAVYFAHTNWGTHDFIIISLNLYESMYLYPINFEVSEI